MFTLQPVTGKDIVGREEVVREIVRILGDRRSNTGFAIYGIRRIGKTSVLKEVESRLKKNKLVVVYLSLWEVTPFTMENFLEQIISGVIGEYKKYLPIKYKIKELFLTPVDVTKRIIKELNVSIKIKEDLEFLLSFKFRGTPLPDLFEKAFQFPEQIAKETKMKCIIILDEFPSLLELKEGTNLVRALRSLHEKQKYVALCISGSMRKTMDAVALSQISPFYKQFLIKEIKSLNKEDVALLLERNFKEHKIKMKEDVTEKVHEITNGIPFYIQFLGKTILAEDIKKIDKKKIDTILQKFLKEEGNVIFLDYLKGFSPKEQQILEAMSWGIEKVKDISKRTGEAVNIISTYLIYLLDKGVIEKKSRGRYEILDPLFKQWLKNRTI